MEWFDNQIFTSMVKNNLPKLFKKAEIESMRGGKIGMEVGVLRERILIALLLKSFGEENVKFDFSSTDNSKDTQIFDDILSIKTFMNNGYGGVKVFWASDNKTVKNAVDNYIPQNHILISNINWGTKNGGLYLISLNTQLKIFNTIGVENYLKINNHKYFVDQSNFDEKYKRNYFRHTFSNKFLENFSSGVKKSFEYLQIDLDSLNIQNIPIKKIKELEIFLNQNDDNLNIRTIDLSLKKRGFLLTSAQRNEILKHSAKTKINNNKFNDKESNKDDEGQEIKSQQGE
jgi:hypothetical protein